VATVPYIEFAGVRFNSLAGQGVIVTGGASGIGADIVRAFAQQGCKVGFVDRDEAAGRALAASLPETFFESVDVTDVPALKAAIERLAARTGGVDVLVNNVAMTSGTASRASRRPTSTSASRSTCARTSLPRRRCWQHARPAAAAHRQHGLGQLEDQGRGYAVYATCKSADAGLHAGAWRATSARTTSASTASCRAGTMTERQRRAVAGRGGRAPRWTRTTASPGASSGMDIAHMVLFLAADTARMVTAQEFVVDAGWA
jgi:NAD(P)-dependent dehydrogenase (short-subunit alcohol dehydrogenase family)